jgi:hypothetical protein
MSPVSGSTRKRSVDHHARRSEKRYAFVHPKDQSRNWFVDGHRNIACMCGSTAALALNLKRPSRKISRVSRPRLPR